MILYDRLSLLLSSLFFFIVGTFWLLGSLQEPIFYHLVGRQYHPQVNVVSFVCIMPLLFLCMAALNRWRPQRVLGIAAVLYAVFFAVMAFLLTVPGVGLVGTVPHVHNLLGWAYFAVVKTYGSLMVTLFWTYAATLVSVDRAKKMFPFITVCAQVGSIVGATLVRVGSEWGIPLLVAIAAVGIGCVAGTVWILESDASLAQSSGVPQGSSVGMWEGLLLVISRPYLRGVFVVSTIYLLIGAFFDYQFHYLASLHYPDIQSFSWFKGVFGQLVNGCTLLLALCGTGWFLRVLGVAGCLLLYPIATAVCVAAASLYPTLWVVTAVLVITRALSIGLNNPTKEIVYIPEPEHIRFKAKGWIDVVGYRAMFAAGCEMTAWIAQPQSLFIAASAGISYVVIAVWLYYARVVGKRFAEK